MYQEVSALHAVYTGLVNGNVTRDYSSAILSCLSHKQGSSVSSISIHQPRKHYLAQRMIANGDSVSVQLNTTGKCNGTNVPIPTLLLDSSALLETYDETTQFSEAGRSRRG